MPDPKINLLIVDDEPPTRRSLSQIFTGLGYSVRSAEDGFSALFEIRQSVPDILISDLNMPGMSGFELLSVVRRRFAAIQVIAMSGAIAGDGLQAGVAADAFYEKGTNLRSLFRIMEAMSQPARQPSFRPSSSLAPIWIPRQMEDNSDAESVVITCPECLRAFPEILGEQRRLIQETGCVHCFTLIHYAIIQPTDPASPQSFQRKPGTEAPAAFLVPDGN
jgi:CheY-like chemotaxis protein